MNFTMMHESMNIMSFICNKLSPYHSYLLLIKCIRLNSIAMMCDWANSFYVSNECGACLGPLDPSRQKHYIIVQCEEPVS
jgi:hypothetical protein